MVGGGTGAAQLDAKLRETYGAGLGLDGEEEEKWPTVTLHFGTWQCRHCDFETCNLTRAKGLISGHVTVPRTVDQGKPARCAAALPRGVPLPAA